MKKAYSFEVNGNIYQLRFNINSLCEIEDLLGKPLSKIGADMGIKEMRILFYCGLIPKMRLEDCGELMDIIIEEKGITGLNEIVEKSMALANMGGSPVPDEIKKKV